MSPFFFFFFFSNRGDQSRGDVFFLVCVPDSCLEVWFRMQSAVQARN